MGKVTRWDHVVKRLRWGEDTLAIVILFVMTMLPFLASITRVLNISSIPASQVLVQHCTLWIGFLGAVLAARKNKLLALTREPLFKKEEGFLNGDKIKNYSGPLLIIHAEDDHIIPFSQGELLYNFCPSENKILLPIPNANHNNILSVSFQEYFEEIAAFVKP